MPVTKGALLHQLVQRVEELERRVAQLEVGRSSPPAKKAAPKPAEK
jgi:hypothetical protein